jgi:ABC-type glycerol-3-phosphate transport system substrate-binding protein
MFGFGTLLERMCKMKQKVVYAIFSLLLAGSLLGGCSAGSGETALQGAPEDDILTTSPVDQSKTLVTIRVEFGAGQRYELEKVLEEQFPDVDIVLQHDGSTDSIYTMRANLENGVECDLIVSRRLPTIADVADEYLLDLSSESFVNNYYMTAVDSCADSEGHLYYLPGPMDVYGYIYDKTLFDEHGWEVPHSYTEFVELLQTIGETGDGIVPLQQSIMYPDSFVIMFNTYNYQRVFEGRDNYLWLNAYQNGEETMIGHMEPAVEHFKKLMEDGIFSTDDFEVTPSTRSSMLYEEHSTAMVVDCQNAVTFAEERNCDHEIAMMPIWTSDEEDSDFLYGIPSYYWAINKSSAEESPEKKQLLLDILSFIGSIDGQMALIGDDFQVSNVEGVPMNESSFSENILDTVGKGNVINAFYLADGETNKQVEREMLGTSVDLLSGNMTDEEWLLAADAARDSVLAGTDSDETVYGQAEETLTRLESAYTVARMYAEVMDAPIGIVQAGGWEGSTNGYFYQGDITDSSLACLSANKESPSDEEIPWNGHIVAKSMTGQEIVDILNSTVDLSTKGLDPYYVAYGLQVEFAPWGGVGNRVVSCKLADGTELDMDASYDVAFYYGSLPDAELTPDRRQEGTWTENFAAWLEGIGGTIKKPEMTLELEYQQDSEK